MPTASRRKRSHPDAHVMRAAIERAVKLAGGQAPLARLVPCTQPLVAYWVKVGYVTADYVLPVERAVHVSRHRLRPDLYPTDDGRRRTGGDREIEPGAAA